MVGVSELKRHHLVTEQALHIHQQWDDLDAQELLPLAISLRDDAESLSAAGGDDWDRKGELSSHLGCLVDYLEKGKKERCWTDIKDLIYADLPRLGFRLLSLADSAATKHA